MIILLGRSLFATILCMAKIEDFIAVGGLLLEVASCTPMASPQPITPSVDARVTPSSIEIEASLLDQNGLGYVYSMRIEHGIVFRHDRRMIDKRHIIVERPVTGCQIADWDGDHRLDPGDVSCW